MAPPRHEHPADDAVVRSFADTVDSLWTKAANRSITELDWLEHVKDALYVEHAARTGLAQGAAAEWSKALAATHAFAEAYAPLRVRLGKLEGAIGAVLGGWRTQMLMAPLSRLVHVADAAGRAGCSRMLLDLLLAALDLELSCSDIVPPLRGTRPRKGGAGWLNWFLRRRHQGFRPGAHGLC